MHLHVQPAPTEEKVSSDLSKLEKKVPDDNKTGPPDENLFGQAAVIELVRRYLKIGELTLIWICRRHRAGGMISRDYASMPISNLFNWFIDQHPDMSFLREPFQTMTGVMQFSIETQLQFGTQLQDALKIARRIIGILTSEIETVPPIEY